MSRQTVLQDPIKRRQLAWLRFFSNPRRFIDEADMDSFELAASQAMIRIQTVPPGEPAIRIYNLCEFLIRGAIKRGFYCDERFVESRA